MSDLHPIFDAKLSEMDIAVFDLETTGLHSSKDAIIQIAAVQVNRAELGDDWMSFIDPGPEHRPIPDFIQDFTGIQDGQLDGAPNLKSMMETFDEFVGTRIVAGHNVARFDLGFIRRAEVRTGVEVQSDYFIDTLKLMRRLHPVLESKKLAACGTFYGIDFDANALHDALADTRLGAQVMLKQFEDLSDRGVETFSDMLQFLS
ncbi:3'-5' exonuclease [Phaeobacter sp.]|uniref:3'-5' exonuclease n=1 Tax=Phaeobacter sp. TaxID=1902409 RepID=UPI0025F17908|nr:3'-5' exonuclease [Phaeobacter sp.]